MIFNRVNFNGSLIGCISETQELMNYYANNLLIIIQFIFLSNNKQDVQILNR